MARHLCALLLLAHIALVQADTGPDHLKYVNQLIGTNNGGNVFAGATLPYGVAKAVADTNSSSAQGGFTTDGSPITGFSMLHDSGTGYDKKKIRVERGGLRNSRGELSLGDFALFPYQGCANDEVDGCIYPKKARATPFLNESLKASPGYFSLTLQSGINVAMTAAQHTALFRFSFGSEASIGNASSSPLILMDLTDLSNSRQDNASISVDGTTGRMTGNGRFLPSFGTGNYVAYFCADFHGAIRDNGIFVNTRANTTVKDLQISRGINGYPLPGGAFNRFSSRSDVLVRVGLSFISSEQACSLAESEIPDYDFDATLSAAQSAWTKQLSPIEVATTGINDSTLTNFYSGIYRVYVNPQNYTGIVPTVSGDAVWWDSFYCIWDLFRSQMPFQIITDTSAFISQLQGLLNIYQYQGWLPDCHMSLCKGYTQGGSNADVVFADAYSKINSSEIDWKMAYEAVVKDAEEEPYDWCCQGRGGLDSWKSHGYIPQQDFDYKGFGTMTRSISRTLEYAYNDFCISEIAGGSGNQGDQEKYQKSSENWLNLFKPDQTSYINDTDTGFVGFFQPKFLNETWGFQDPLYCSNIDTNPNSVCSLQAEAGATFESSIWEYSFYVPHDQAKLISTFGGPRAFVRRLEYLHDKKITYIGNEPAFLTVYQYHYAGRPALSARRAHFYIPDYFQPTEGGLPGNDDSGTMGAFVAMSMMGLFPSPGQNVYFIIPPFFESVNITSPVTGNVARIRNVNFDASYNNIYIQKATLDGQDYTKNWIDHSFFTEGKELVLYLGANESSWGTHVADLPPSLSEYQGY